MEYPAGLMCVKCGEFFGHVLNPSKYIAKSAWDIEAICAKCVEQLTREKGITPESPEDWAYLLEDLL